ncbi:hypothetical protein MXB_1064, partial [Myxobolus squamalis]
LGINFYSIGKRTISVVNPFIHIPSSVLEESDLAGPLVYFVIFGLLLLLSGKLNGFGAIYGLTASSTFSIKLRISKELSILGFLFSGWSSFVATNMVNTLNPNQDQFLLILYPFIIIYGFFANMIIFPY